MFQVVTEQMFPSAAHDHNARSVVKSFVSGIHWFVYMNIVDTLSAPSARSPCHCAQAAHAVYRLPVQLLYIHTFKLGSRYCSTTVQVGNLPYIILYVFSYVPVASYRIRIM